MNNENRILSYLEIMDECLKKAVYTHDLALPQMINLYCDYLTSSGNIECLQHANILRNYNLNYVINVNLIAFLRDQLFNNFYDLISENYDFCFILEGRRKSFLKTETKIRNYLKNNIQKIPDDLFGFRVVLSGASYDQCYTVFNDLVELCIKKGFILIKTKDYIKSPKPNGYSSLHSIFQSQDGKTFEVQIRTIEDHLKAEYSEEQNHLNYDLNKYQERLDIDLSNIKLKNSMFTSIPNQNGEFVFYDEAGFLNSLTILTRRKSFNEIT